MRTGVRIRGIGRLRQSARWVSRRFTHEALILLYHRVVELSSDPYLLGVRPQRFAEHLEILRKHGRPMQLHQLAQALRDGNLPRRALVVTFDDGYADNLYTAKPLLERFEVPATIFVTTGYIGRDREFWWDELERLLLQPGILPETLRLNIGAGVCEWKLGDTVCYSEDDYQQHVSWTVAKVAPQYAITCTTRFISGCFLWRKWKGGRCWTNCCGGLAENQGLAEATNLFHQMKSSACPRVE